MAPDDPRHGTNRGYAAERTAGIPYCEACRKARADYERKRGHAVYLGQPRMYPAHGARRRVQALQRLGWTLPHIAREAGWNSPQALSFVIAPERTQTRRASFQRIAATYDRLSMTVPPPSAASTRTKRNAERNGWPPPLAWDDIDDPNEQPTGWEYVPADRGDILRDLDARGAGISEVCDVLELRRDTVEKWCERHGMSVLFSRLVGRETTPTSRRFNGNQHRKVS